MRAHLLLLCLLSNMPVLFAQEIGLQIIVENRSINIMANLLGDHGEQVLSSMNDGLESQITFQFRTYRRTKGLLAIFGDRLLSEEKLIYRARKNIFDDSFQIESDDGATRIFMDKEEFLQAFFTAYSSAFENYQPLEDEQYYILVRIRLDHVKLDPPLNLITLFNPIGITTDWREAPLPRLGGD